MSKHNLHEPGELARLAADIGRHMEAPSSALPRAVLPELPPHFVGRDEVANKLAATLKERRLVSVVGPGGLGKTTLAVAVARRLSACMTGGVCLLDLARLSSGDALEAELWLALGIDAAQGPLRERLRHRLAGQPMLLVLDSCETIIEAAAELVEDLLVSVPEVLILVTSREPLRARGEQVHRLAPLASPPDAGDLPVWLAMTYSALQLFFNVARSRDAALAPTSGNLALASTICGRLDGSPLAITLVASHVRRLGLDKVASQLGPELLSLGTDAQAARHSSLEAVLDWSHRLLQPDEQRAFRALSCLRGSFDLDTAVIVIAGSRGDAMNIVLDLSLKSLLMAVHIGDTTLYRMPDITRVYAQAQLERTEAEEFRGARTRHAHALMQLLATAEQRWNTMGTAEWRRSYGVWIEDVRHALTWAFSDNGDSLIGTELTVAVLQLAEQTGLFTGFDEFARRALREVISLDPPRPELAVRMYTFPAFGQLRAVRDDPSQIATLAKAVDIRDFPGATTARLGAMVALWANSFQLGRYQDALKRSADIQQLDASDWVVDLTARRTRAQSLHFLGEHVKAKALVKGVLAQAGRSIPLAYTPSPVSLQVSMRIMLARIHWIEGEADQAWKTVQECVAIAEQDAPPSICQALAIAAIPIALWCGNREQCTVWVAQLLEHSTQYEFQYYRAWARLIEVAMDEGGADLPAHAAALQTLPSGEQTKYRDHLGTFEPSSLAVDTLARAQTGAVGWCAPEVLRLQAEHVAAEGGPHAHTVASGLLAHSLALAREQGALAWELRTAISMSRLSQSQGDPEAGRRLLQSVYGQFREGFATRDLSVARDLLAAR